MDVMARTPRFIRSHQRVTLRDTMYSTATSAVAQRSGAILSSSPQGADCDW